MVGNLLMAPVAVAVIIYFVNQPRLGAFKANARPQRAARPDLPLRARSGRQRPAGMALMAAPQPRLEVVRAIAEVGVVAVVRLPDAAQAHAVAGALVAGGVTRHRGHDDGARGPWSSSPSLAGTAPPGVIVGAGTVLDAATAAAVIDAGAAFVVSPVFRADVVATCRTADRRRDAWLLHTHRDPERMGRRRRYRQGLPCDLARPGVLQRRAGAAAAGAVDADRRSHAATNAGDWIRAGAAAIGVGSALVDRAAVRDGRLRRHHRQRTALRRGGRGRPRRGIGRRRRWRDEDRCFGEIMLRLSPPGLERFFQSPALQASFGGGEANVAVSLAHFGCDSHYVTRLPANPIGDAALRALRAEGVGVEHVLRGGLAARPLLRRDGREPAGVDGRLRPRATRRSASCSPGSVPWAASIAGAAWFHWTGITPALGPVGRGVHARGDRGRARAPARTVSVDLNYRRKLWSRGRRAAGDASARAVRRPRHRQRGRPAGRARHRGGARRRHQRRARRRRLPRRRRARDAAISAWHRSR